MSVGGLHFPVVDDVRARRAGAGPRKEGSLRHTMLRILIKVVTATAIVTLVLMSAGDHLREMIPERHHQAAWLTGVMLFCFCVLVAAIVQRSSPVNQRRLENMLLTGAVIGALLFLLFISEMECSMKPSARGSTLSCRYTGEL